MGIDLLSARFLAAAARQGAVAREILMLGRQSILFSSDKARATAWGGNPTAQGALPGRRRADDYADDFFLWLGAKSVHSLDLSDYEGATLLADLNQAVPVEWHGRFDCVFDGGTTEHIFDPAQAARNIRDMLRPGGWLISIVPGNNFMGHGFYQFSPEFLFRAYGRDAGFGRTAVYAAELSERGDGRFFRIIDPAVSGERGIFRNALPLHLYCLAQRAGQVGTAPVPMQSDYVTAWSGAEGKDAGPARPENARLKRGFRQIAMRAGGLWLKSVLPMRWNERYFQRLDSLEENVRDFVQNA